MKKSPYYFSFAALILFSLPLTAYQWETFGPAGICANSYTFIEDDLHYEVICTDSGIILNENAQWQEYSYSGLPVWDVEVVVTATADLIFAIGDGSDSDGIYAFNYSNHEFYLLLWLMNPRFITYCPADSSFYAGGEEGLFRSSHGLSWQSVPFFDGLSCHDMAYYGGNYVVTAAGNTYYSQDAGQTWSMSSSYYPITRMAVTSNGTFYGIFPGQSYSSGLYSSIDFGANWSVEFWSIDLAAVSIKFADNVFVGWEFPHTTYTGVACWLPDIQEIDFVNDGLNCHYINGFSLFPLINCPNLVACSDDGLYLLTGYSADSNPEEITSHPLSIRNFPNPFNPSTTISFLLSKSTRATIDIYNAKGQLVNNLYSGYLHSGTHSHTWNGLSNSDAPLSSGFYHCRITTPEFSANHKLLLLK
jgi:hypothetical protein